MPDGYAAVRVNSRGAGRSPGLLDIWSLREAMHYRNCIEWAWSTGKVGVGLKGVS